MSLGSVDPNRIALSKSNVQQRENITREGQRANTIVERERILAEERKRHEQEPQEPRYKDPALNKASVPKDVMQALAVAKQEGGIKIYKDRFYGTQAEKAGLKALEAAQQAESLQKSIEQYKLQGIDTSTLEKKLASQQATASKLWQQAIGKQVAYLAEKVGGKASAGNIDSALDYTRYIYDYTGDTGEFSTFAESFIGGAYDKYQSQRERARRNRDNTTDPSRLEWQLDYRKKYGVDPSTVMVQDEKGGEVPITKVQGLTIDDANKAVTDFAKAKAEGEKTQREAIQQQVSDEVKKFTDEQIAKGINPGKVTGHYDQKADQIVVQAKDAKLTVDAQRNPEKYNLIDWEKTQFTNVPTSVYNEALTNVNQRIQASGGGKVTQAELNKEVNKLLTTKYKDGVPVLAPVDINIAYQNFSDTQDAFVKANENLRKASEGLPVDNLTKEEINLLTKDVYIEYRKKLNEIKKFNKENNITPPIQGPGLDQPPVEYESVYTDPTNPYAIEKRLKSIYGIPTEDGSLASRFAGSTRLNISGIETERINAEVNKIKNTKPEPMIAERLDNWLKYSDYSPNVPYYQTNAENLAKSFAGTIFSTADSIALLINQQFNSPSVYDIARGVADKDKNAGKVIIKPSTTFEPTLKQAKDEGYDYVVGQKANPLDVGLLVSNPQEYFDKFNITKEVKEKGAPAVYQQFSDPKIMGSLLAFAGVSAIPIPGSQYVTQGIKQGAKFVGSGIQTGIGKIANNQTIRTNAIDMFRSINDPLQMAYGEPMIKTPSELKNLARSEKSLSRYYPNYEGMRILDNTFGPSFSKSVGFTADVAKRDISVLSSTQKLTNVDYVNSLKQLTDFEDLAKGVGFRSSPLNQAEVLPKDDLIPALSERPSKVRPTTEKDVFGNRKEFEELFNVKPAGDKIDLLPSELKSAKEELSLADQLRKFDQPTVNALSNIANESKNFLSKNVGKRLPTLTESAYQQLGIRLTMKEAREVVKKLRKGRIENLTPEQKEFAKFLINWNNQENNIWQVPESFTTRWAKALSSTEEKLFSTEADIPLGTGKEENSILNRLKKIAKDNDNIGSRIQDSFNANPQQTNAFLERIGFGKAFQNLTDRLNIPERLPKPPKEEKMSIQEILERLAPDFSQGGIASKTSMAGILESVNRPKKATYYDWLKGKVTTGETKDYAKGKKNLKSRNTKKDEPYQTFADLEKYTGREMGQGLVQLQKQTEETITKVKKKATPEQPPLDNGVAQAGAIFDNAVGDTGSPYISSGISELAKKPKKEEDKQNQDLGQALIEVKPLGLYGPTGFEKIQKKKQKVQAELTALLGTQDVTPEVKKVLQQFIETGAMEKQVTSFGTPVPKRTLLKPVFDFGNLQGFQFKFGVDVPTIKNETIVGWVSQFKQDQAKLGGFILSTPSPEPLIPEFAIPVPQIPDKVKPPIPPLMGFGKPRNVEQPSKKSSLKRESRQLAVADPIERTLGGDWAKLLTGGQFEDLQFNEQGELVSTGAFTKTGKQVGRKAFPKKANDDYLTQFTKKYNNLMPRGKVLKSKSKKGKQKEIDLMNIELW